jgi:hypothetical protein
MGKNEGPCSVQDCGRKAFATGLCTAHYYRKRKGQPLDGPIHDKASETFEGRFRRNTVTTEHGLIWVGATSGPYGQFAYEGKNWWAHRAAWVITTGAPIADGHHIDHNPDCPKTCVTFEHLRSVTPAEHLGLSRERGEMTDKPRLGHFTPTVVRQCKVDGCWRQMRSNGYCSAHNHRLMRYGDPATDVQVQERLPPRKDRGCLVDGCGARHNAKGYCLKHYAQLKRKGEV